MTQLSILLAGSPNSGKSTLFNTLTGSKQKVANYPGVTVEKKTGRFTTPKGKEVEVLDLPGIYSLTPYSLDEEIAHKRLTNPQKDLVVAVTDATHLERSLAFVLEIKQLKKPIVLVLNMSDLAYNKRILIDVAKLQESLGVPVVQTNATHSKGVEDLVRAIDQLDLEQHQQKADSTEVKKLSPEQRFQKVDTILAKCIKKPTNAEVVSQKIDRVLLHPILGGLFFAVFIFGIFQAIFTFAEAPMNLIESSVAFVGEFVRNFIPDGFVQSFIVDGIIAGVGAVLVFLPQILILFFFIFLMESTGYMARAAFIMDKMMSLIGLQGRAFVPLLSSFACAIPGIMATRTIKNPKERLTTILIAPLMTCSARLPVYILLIGAFIPNTKIWGFINIQGLVMAGLFVFAIITAIIVAFVMRKTTLKGRKSSFIMELPAYKIPNMRHLFLNLWHRTKNFIKKAGGFIMWVSITLWFLSTFPQPPQDWDQPAINYSIAGRVGHFIEPVFEPLGFDWRISTGLIPGFAAREVMVSALATVFALDDTLGEEQQTKTLTEKLQSTWSLGTGLALLVWYIFAPQCLATFVVAKKETGGWKWPIFMFTYMFALAYIGAFITYQVVQMF